MSLRCSTAIAPNATAIKANWPASIPRLKNSNANGNSNLHYRNNLVLGTNHPTKPVLRNITYTAYSSSDYNGYRPNANGRPLFIW